MTLQIKTNEEGFLQALRELTININQFEMENQELFQVLSRLGDTWTGDGSEKYLYGSQCIYATGVTQEQNLKQLRADIIQTQIAIANADKDHANSFETNIQGR